MAGFIFGAGTDISDPKELARRRAVIDAMMAQERGAPRNVGEGIYSFSKSITDAITSRNLKRQEDKAREEAAGVLPGIVDLLNMGGQSYGGASAPAVSTQPIARTPDSAGGIADDTMKALGKTPMGPYRDAIASIESAGSGDYSAIGPTNARLGRALGRYQIMEANIGPWSREVLGREVTPDEFLANPQIQDAIFDGKFGGYVEKFGPEGAAQAWFAGPGGVGKMDRQDVLGTSVADYTRKFSAALGSQPSGQPAQPNAGTRTFNPEIINQLAALSSNPYASEGQRQIAALLMQQQIQQMMPQKVETQFVKGIGLINSQTGEVINDFGGMAGGAGAELPAAAATLEWRAKQAGLTPGTPEYQEFILNGGGDPATFRALDMQAQASGYMPGTPEYADFMATRGAFQQAYGRGSGQNQADIDSGGAAAAAIAGGKIEGENAANAAANLSGNLAQADQAIGLIESIMNDPALASITGMIQGNLPPLTQAGTDLNVKIKQLQGKAFLEAFESLKGGGAITEREGQAATEAMARLDRAQSTEEYVAALTELRDIMQTGADRARASAGQAEDNPQGDKPPAQAPQRFRYNPETGELE